MVRVYRVFGREGSSVFLVGEVCLGYSRARYRRPGPGFDPAHPRFSIGIVWIGGTVESAYTVYTVKVQGVTDWLQPAKVKDIQSFIGFMNFYWRFICNFSEIACPLHMLTQMSKGWSCG